MKTRRNLMKEFGTPPILKRKARTNTKARRAAYMLTLSEGRPKPTDPDNTYDESTNPSNGWRAPEREGPCPRCGQIEDHADGCFYGGATEAPDVSAAAETMLADDLSKWQAWEKAFKVGALFTTFSPSKVVHRITRIEDNKAYGVLVSQKEGEL